MTWEEIKGAFKDFPIEQQPERIPLEVYDGLVEFIKYWFCDLADEMFMPNAHKKAFGKTSTGDLDVVYVPNDREHWVDDIIYNNANGVLVAHKTNGPQLMTVMKYNGHQYMVDFLLTKLDEFEWRKTYIGYGTLIPAVIGSFARSLRDKFAQDGFYARVKDEKGNYHNMKLTTDPHKAFNVLGLGNAALDTDELYTVEGVAKWVIGSPRFDSERWNQPPAVDGQTIVTKNRKSHAACKKKDEVIACYEIIDKANKKATWVNPNYGLERHHFGEKFIDDMLEEVKKIQMKSRTVLDGREIMEVTELRGPEIGRAKEFLINRPEFINLTQEELNKPENKQLAINMLKHEYIDGDK
jgi:hypothetical protein